MRKRHKNNGNNRSDSSNKNRYISTEVVAAIAGFAALIIIMPFTVTIRRLDTFIEKVRNEHKEFCKEVDDYCQDGNEGYVLDSLCSRVNEYCNGYCSKNSGKYRLNTN